MKKSIQETKLHDHTCLIFENETEFFHCAIPFIREGLKKHEKCLLVIDEITREDILRRFTTIFREGHIPPSEFGNKGRITIENFKNVYLSNGKFDKEKTKNFYLNFLKKSLEEGYTGIRVYVEIGSAAKDYIGGETFLDWEKFADPLFLASKFLAVCAYNKRYFTPEYLKSAVKAHPIEIDIIKTRF